MCIRDRAKGVEGIDFKDGEDCLIVDDPAGFAEAVIALSSNPQLQRQLLLLVYQGGILPTSCHCLGKLLPRLWQSFANAVAKSCQWEGKTLSLIHISWKAGQQSGRYLVYSRKRYLADGMDGAGCRKTYRESPYHSRY